MLNQFEPLDEDPMARSRICREEGCDAQAVVDNPYKGKFHPMCFYHGFVAALDEDPEAQKLALGWAVAEGLSDRNVARRNG